MKCLPLVFLASGLMLGLSGASIAPGDTGIGFEPAILELAKGLAKAERVEIYEGLPSPMVERDLFKKEKQTKICRQIADEWFYSLPEEVKFEHILGLQRLVDAGLFRPWGGLKFCGGFHADWAVAMPTGKSTLYVLFCFGCHEAKIIREDKPFAADLRTTDFRLTTDLYNKSFEELRALLAAYRKERPEPDYGAVRRLAPLPAQAHAN